MKNQRILWKQNGTCKRILRNRSWASMILKPRILLVQISRRWSFLTLLINPSPAPPRRGFFFATTRRPQQGLGLTVILLPPLPSISQANSFPKTTKEPPLKIHLYKNPKISILVLKFGSSIQIFGGRKWNLKKKKKKNKREGKSKWNGEMWSVCAVKVNYEKLYWKSV